MIPPGTFHTSEEDWAAISRNVRNWFAYTPEGRAFYVKMSADWDKLFSEYTAPYAWFLPSRDVE